MDDILKNDKGWRFQLGLLRGASPVIDLIGCVVLFGIFWVYLRSSLALPPPLNDIDIGAGGFPRLLALATLVAIVAMAISAIYRLLDRVPVSWVSVRRPVFVALTIGLLILQSVYFEQLGALPCVMLFGLLTMLACGERRVLHLIGVPIALAAFIYVVFVLALHVNLP